jgi:hypothetical protein
MQNFTFNGRNVTYFAEQTQHMHDFESVVQYFQRQGAGRGKAITLARKTHPERYNVWMAGGRQRSAAQRQPRHVNVMDDMRSRVAFRGA